MPLSTLQDVKSRLRLGSAAHPQDGVLEAFRAAAEEKVLGLTGFTFSGGVKTEQQTKVQLGFARTMRLRPLLPLSPDPAKAVTVEVRSLASGTYDKILGDLIDPYEGKVLPLASSLTPVFPPMGGQGPWHRWKQMIWEVARFTYSVDPLGSGTNPVPSELKTAAVELAVSMYARAGGGAVTDVSVEGVSESYLEAPVPPVVTMLLARYVRGKVVMAW